MRHVSRTQRVYLDWLFDRINLEKAIHARYVNTAQQIADVLTWCSLSQERWMQLTHLRGFMTHQTNSCSPHVVFSSCLDRNMWKRAGEMPDEQVSAKSKLIRGLCLSEKKRWITSDEKGQSRKLHAERTPESREPTRYRKQRNVGIQRKRITKFSMKTTNRHCIITMRWWHMIWLLNGCRVHPCRNKAAQETMRYVQRFLPQESNPGAIYTDSSVEFTKECEGLSWNHEKSEPHRSDTNGIAQRTARRIKEGTSTVFSPIKIGWTTVGWSDGMLFGFTDVIIYGEMKKKTPFKRRYDTSFRVPMVPFGSEIFYHPFSIRRQEHTSSI